MSKVIEFNDINKRSFKTINEYPENLNARDVADYLNISIAMAYNLLNSKRCPSFRIKKAIRISKEAFIRFLRDNEGGQLIDEVR